MSGKLRAKKINGNRINLFKIFKSARNKIREWLMGKGNAMEMTGKLFAKKTESGGLTIDFGMIANNSVTDAGAGYLVDSFQSSTGSPMDDFKWHEYGTGTGAEAVGDTTLGTAAGLRVSGSSTETSAMVWKTVATKTSTGTHAVTEHGIFSSSDSTTLWDRSLFAAINVTSGDSIEFTYELTVTPGG